MILFMQAFDNEKSELINEAQEIKDVLLRSIIIDAICAAEMLQSRFDAKECIYAQLRAKLKGESMRDEHLIFAFGMHGILTRSIKFISGYNLIVLRDGFSVSFDSMPEELKENANRMGYRQDEPLTYGPVGVWFQPPSDPEPSENKVRMNDRADDIAGIGGSFAGAFAAAFQRFSS